MPKISLELFLVKRLSWRACGNPNEYNPLTPFKTNVIIIPLEYLNIVIILYAKY